MVNPYILEIILLVILFYAIITQVIIPGIKRTPIFPFFRKKEIQSKISNMNENLEILELKNKLNELTDKYNKQNNTSTN